MSSLAAKLAALFLIVLIVVAIWLGHGAPLTIIEPTAAPTANPAAAPRVNPGSVTTFSDCTTKLTTMGYTWNQAVASCDYLRHPAK